jgi:hypothetical protein
MLAFGLVFVSCDNGTTRISGAAVPGNNLAEKLAWLQDNAESGGSYIVELKGDESTAPVELNYSGRTGITIGLRGSGANRTISFSSNRQFIGVISGVTLVLDRNITFKGQVLVRGGRKLVMNAGSTITGNRGMGGVYRF